MKKFLSCVMGAVFAFTTVAVAASCGEEWDKAPLKVTVEVAETATTVCGADYKVPDAVVRGVEDYDMEISIAATAGGTVNYNEETKSFYAKNLGAPAYTITYTASYQDAGKTETAVGVTKLSTTDGEKPTISAPDYVTGVRGGKVEIPEAAVIDNSGEAIEATYVVKDDAGAVVQTVKENEKEYVQISETVKWYTVVYSASDSSGNRATDHECKIWIRSSADEVEFFDTEELVEVETESAAATVVAASEAPQGGKGNVLKIEIPAKGDDNGGYVSFTVRNLGVTDFTNVTKLKMKVLSTVALSNWPGWHAGNSIVPGKLNGASAGKGVEANTWTELVWKRAEVQEMFNGATEGNYARPVIDDVTELRFDIDNAGWWGEQTEADGGGTQWLSQSFVLYIDSIEVEQMDLNWTPRFYETDAATFYEINTFNDEARFGLLNTINSPADNFSLSLSDLHTTAFDPSAPETENQSLKVQVKGFSNGYPRFVMPLEKLSKILDLGTLPDNAVFMVDIYLESSTGEKVVLDGADNIVFYEKGNPAEKKPKLKTGLWLDVGTSATAAVTVESIKDASIDLGNLDSVGFFFYVDADWGGNCEQTVYFDNFRIEVPKAPKA